MSAITGTIGPALAKTVGFDLLEDALAQDVHAALRAGLKHGATFHDGRSALAIFRHALAAAIGRIHEDGRAPLFLRFLSDGPYEDAGDIPAALRSKRLTDDETTSVIAFIYSHMVNCFKGAITEILAVEPCLHILRKMQREKRVPREARLYVGDAVWASASRGAGFAKGGDLHILAERRSPKSNRSIVVAGVAEVKSYFCQPDRLRSQLDKHFARARRGLRVGEVAYFPDRITMGWGGSRQAVRISILPARWPLPRRFRFEHRDGRKFLHVEAAAPPAPADSMERVGPTEWRVTLRWSKEALVAAAFGMTFWFMEKVGEVIYSAGVPKDWSEMTPAEAGQNAAKMMLYYAILRCRTAREHQRAIALYNSYGFGCALGMNFRNPEGKREMLWPQDLDEIQASGRNKDGCRIA
ncbi:MAG: hypothetical protein HOP29_07510 [Phycisphaerales bacterium]|nr:hypothetical protein [Phycisphaerales bacterium]